MAAFIKSLMLKSRSQSSQICAYARNLRILGFDIEPVVEILIINDICIHIFKQFQCFKYSLYLFYFNFLLTLGIKISWCVPPN